MPSIETSINTCVLTLLAVLVLGGCARPEAAKPVPFKPTGDVKHIMDFVLDPAADVIWASAGAIITVEGTQDLQPTTDEGWLAVEQSAVVVAESGNLLMMPSRARDDKDWIEISQGLVDVGLRAKAAARAHNADDLFEAGGQIYRVCSSCHQLYIQGEEKPDPLNN
ncbi:MAG: hypothetical protein ABGY96_18655 [bacterium]|nr:hypothetical protein [Gammaproteobacteria bacterium]HIL98852.1 hypothetical protein [Pseudomonadales bacterium]